MKIFFTSDTHFGHANIIKYCDRPFADANDMNEQLIANWNNVVSPDDVVYHLGDFAFGSISDVNRVMHRLNFAHMHFIKGNHDKPFLNWYNDYKCGNDATARKVTIYPHFLETNINKQKFVLCHYAMRVWDQSHRGALHLYGHSHGTLPDDPNSKSFDVGVDCHNYHPISLERVLKIMDKKKVETNFENLPGVKAGIIRE
jgi:calcineurin-like phosphoesterase family protein